MPTELESDPSSWPRLTEPAWVALQVPRFRDIRPRYQTYQAFLREVLSEICRWHAPLGIVETRTKGISSFAEKILRKHASLTTPLSPLPPDPLFRLTDLCGGRVIVQTSKQVQAICHLIERAFVIDWENSQDTSVRLKPQEFGYRSVHYILLVDEARLRQAGLQTAIPAEISGLKAEVQVRTLLEHAWADIGHDLMYKTQVKVPERIQRHFAALAAVLEGVDREFGRLIQSLDEFKSNYGAYLDRDQAVKEIERLEIVLDNDKTSTDLVVRAAQLALMAGRHEQALRLLEGHRDSSHQQVQRLRGEVLCDIYQDTPRHPGFIEGRQALEATSRHPEVSAETLCALAEAWAVTDDAKAREQYHRAAAVDSTEPLTLCRYLEFEIAHLGNDNLIKLAGPMIRNAIHRCEIEIEGGVNLPSAWSSLAVLRLLSGEPFAALEALAQVIDLVQPPLADQRPCIAGRALRRMRQTLRRLACIRERVTGFDWCQRMVLLGLAARADDPEAREELAGLASWHADLTQAHFRADQRFVILAGGCSSEIQPAIDAFRDTLLRATAGLDDLILISGGTRDGISGLAGDIGQQSKGAIRCYGYLPRSLPRGSREDTDPTRFAANFSSPGTDFTPLEPMQAWTDLVTAGVEPEKIKLLGYAGGAIARIEVIMALVFGAQAAVVEAPRLPSERRFEAPTWSHHRRLLRLPDDAMTLRAFFLANELPSERPELEQAARAVHLEYLKSVKPKDPALQPWDKLSPDLKRSCHHQVAYAENILTTAGLRVRPLSDQERADETRPLLDMDQVLGEEGICRLAEMEHGRWNVERLLQGWRFGEVKDVDNKISPFLIPWNQLPPDIQQYDIDAIRAMPANFRVAGLEVYQKP